MLAWEDSFLGGGDEGKIAELRADIVGTREDLLEVGTAAINAGKDIGNNIGDAISEVGAIYEKAAEGVSEISIKANCNAYRLFLSPYHQDQSTNSSALTLATVTKSFNNSHLRRTWIVSTTVEKKFP